jgi:8-oxo-dGTP pyrophosphatase MutT (NUDIX family)
MSTSDQLRGQLDHALARLVARDPAVEPVRARFRSLMAAWPQCLSRDHLPGHLTASAWVICPQTDAVLLTHHRKLNKWLQLGGHVDGDADIERAARREVAEEAGLTEVEPVSWTDASPWGHLFDIDIHEIPAYGAVPPHDHYDVRFLYTVPTPVPPVVSAESHDVAWIPLRELESWTEEESMVRMRARWRELRVTHP